MSEKDAHWRYAGQELDLFAGAWRWKSYWSSKIRKWVAGDVLEVGAGIGTNTAFLQNSEVKSWHCLEPDPRLAARLQTAINKTALLTDCTVGIGTLASLERNAVFDCIIYIDVLEHIEDDRLELSAAAARLRPEGRLVVLSPAHQKLFSQFDAAVGHHRRYDKEGLRRLAPAQCRLSELYYLDAVGLLVSLANRLLLKQSLPTIRQIDLWDRYMVPASRWLDPLLANRLGRSIVAVWTA